MGLLIASAVVAFLAWWITPTGLEPEDVRNSKGEITVRRVLLAVLVQIVIWALIFFFALRIIPHLPHFFSTGWRLPIVVFVAFVCRWFALLMVLQYAWTILRATLWTTFMAAAGRLREWK